MPNPLDIWVNTDIVVISELMKRLDPHQYQVEWSEHTQSLFIESILVRIPLQAFYLDARSDIGTWKIVDGLKRLSAIYGFLHDDFKLTGLDFLNGLEGLYYSQLRRNYQRRILETTLTIHCIELPTSPENLKYIIDRIKGHTTNG
jgi:hypothetical protein